jgi:hypothetical protein
MGVPVTVDVVANDLSPDGRSLILNMSNFYAPHGKLTQANAYSLTYTPDPGFVGAVAITYQITDTIFVVTGTWNVTVYDPNGAKFISQSAPKSMGEGLLYSVSVTMKNTGSNTWDPSVFKLGSQNPQDNGTWGMGRVLLSALVPPGSQAVFSFVVTAPVLAGTYNLQWRMVQEGIEWFGDTTPNIPVAVDALPPGYQGCYKDSSTRALPTQLSSGGDTVESCRTKGSNAGLSYVGLQYYGYCFAGNTVAYSRAPEDQCNTACSANPNESCGGGYRNSIWKTAAVAVSWVKPSGASYGPANTLTVQGSVVSGTGTVQTVWRDLTTNGAWNTIAGQSAPDGNNNWSNTIPVSNFCHTYAIYANYFGLTSPTFTYNGLSSGYCNENAWTSWIQPSYSAGFGPPGSLVVAGGSSGAPAGAAQVTLWWSDVTAGIGWNQGATVTPDGNGTWFNSIPNVNYSHQYSVYAVYDAYSTQPTQGPCTYPGDGSTTYCPR